MSRITMLVAMVGLGALTCGSVPAEAQDSIAPGRSVRIHLDEPVAHARGLPSRSEAIVRSWDADSLRIDPVGPIDYVAVPWGAVRRVEYKAGRTGSAGKGARPRSLFGGLLRCGCCGGAVVATSGRHYGCAARKDRGPAVCEGVQAHRAKVDARLLAAIREDLLSPDAIAEAYYQLHLQKPSAWTLEMDLRPYVEKF